MEKRRQNHSCEQCRKSKKACDGYLVNSTQNRLANTTLPQLDGQDGPSLLLPCSYCLRTKKGCSLNPHWVRSHSRSSQSLPPAEEGCPDDGNALPANISLFHPNNTGSPESFAPSAITPDQGNLVQLFHTPPSQNGDAFAWDAAFAVPHDPIPASSRPPHAAEVPPNYTGDSHLAHLDFMPFTPGNDAPDTLPYTGLEPYHPTSVRDYSSDPSNFDAQSSTFDLPHTLPTAHGSSLSSLSPAPRGVRKPRGNPRDRPGRRGKREESSVSLSPFSVDCMVMAGANRSLISESLVRIYHDVMENNLACWLVEDTCPYKMQRQRDELVLVRQDASPSTQVRSECAGSWSNRMYNRVKQLDRAAQSAKLISLSPSESKRASRALDLTIIAFATQYAQGDRRKQGVRPPSEFDVGMRGEDDGFGDEFEETLQQSLWDQARKAIQDVADLECYRVVFAELIFGMIQKPWAIDDHGKDLAETLRAPTSDIKVKDSIVPQVMEIIAQGGPPVFLERATRKIHALKYRFEAREIGMQDPPRPSCAARDDGAIQSIGMEERQTVGLLYWFAVMTDTVSSSMNGRPVSVSDEECPHDGARAEPSMATTSSGDDRPCMKRRWALRLYAQDDPQKPSPLHWPCSVEDAARAVTKSAAVKVLLFRHVIYLQNALRNRESGQAVEEVIGVTLSVYRYWYKTHGVLFRDLTSNYEATPARIKSWFTCIAIPWHLACLMLADLMDFVDGSGLGLEAATAERIDADLAAQIRRRSAIELADLAAVSIPGGAGDAPSAEQMPELHFAVNESPLLTEPWTMLLIRAFTQASIFHLGEVERLRKQEWARREDLRASMRWGENCIRAIQLLGTKSDMARAISSVLYRPLDGHDEGSQDMFMPSEVPVF